MTVPVPLGQGINISDFKGEFGLIKHSEPSVEPSHQLNSHDVKASCHTLHRATIPPLYPVPRGA